MSDDTPAPRPREQLPVPPCWREVNARFGVSTYTDLPAARYDEIVQFIKEQYRTLTSEDLGAAEQGRMDL